jgi:hypothetical protein
MGRPSRDLSVIRVAREVRNSSSVTTPSAFVSKSARLAGPDDAFCAVPDIDVKLAMMPRLRAGK